MPHVYLNEDIKGFDGLWVRTFYEAGIQFHTKADQVYSGMIKRCIPTGDFQQRFPTYTGCQNYFKDFNSFAAWCQKSPGYNHLWNNKPWCLDKDILIKGNKIYSEETCCFVPEFINVLFSNKTKSGKYELPIGVSLHTRGKYRARCYTTDGRLHLGMFSDLHDAHKAWQACKISAIIDAANIYKKLEGASDAVYVALIERAALIERDMLKSEETTYI